MILNLLNSGIEFFSAVRKGSSVCITSLLISTPTGYNGRSSLLARRSLYLVQSGISLILERYTLTVKCISASLRIKGTAASDCTIEIPAAEQPVSIDIFLHQNSIPSIRLASSSEIWSSIIFFSIILRIMFVAWSALAFASLI